MSPPAFLAVASYNIHRCIGGDGIASPERTAEVLRELDADIIAGDYDIHWLEKYLAESD